MDHSSEAGQTQKPSARRRPKTPPAKTTPGIVNWAMGLLSVGLTVGFIYWGVQLSQRDPASLPVIRAAEGPARQLPRDPEGQIANFQGLSVNSVQSQADTKDINTIVLAPAPEEVEDDVAPAFVPEAPNAPDAGVQSDPLSSDPDAPNPIRSVTAEEAQKALEEAIALARIGTENQPADQSAPAENQQGQAVSVQEDRSQSRQNNATSGAGVQAEADTDEAAPAAAPGAETSFAPLQSSLPKLRPAKAAAQPSATEESVNPDPATRVAVAPTSRPAQTSDNQEASSQNGEGALANEVAQVPVGTRLIQIGAFDSRSTAREIWKEVSARHQSLLAGRTIYIEPVQKNTTTLYRLRVLGFNSTDEARNHCIALENQNTPCITAIQR